MTVEEARQNIISQADIMCEICGQDCKDWCGDREALEIAAEVLGGSCPFCGHEVEEWKKS